MVAEAASGKSKHQELQAQAKAAAKARRTAELKDKHAKGAHAAGKEAGTKSPPAEPSTEAADPPVTVLNENSDHPTVKA